MLSFKDPVPESQVDQLQCIQRFTPTTYLHGFLGLGRGGDEKVAEFSDAPSRDLTERLLREVGLEGFEHLNGSVSVKRRRLGHHLDETVDHFVLHEIVGKRQYFDHRIDVPPLVRGVLETETNQAQKMCLEELTSN